jgi:hypothetical protein
MKSYESELEEMPDVRNDPKLADLFRRVHVKVKIKIKGQRSRSISLWLKGLEEDTDELEEKDVCYDSKL